MADQIPSKKQQGETIFHTLLREAVTSRADCPCPSSPTDLQAQYSNFKTQLQQLAQKIGDIEQDAEEHKYAHPPASCFSCRPSSRTVRPRPARRTPPLTSPLSFPSGQQADCRSRTHRSCRLVLETLEPLSGQRKCFRMINGVLVERTVKDTMPAVRSNSDGLKRVLDDLVKQYQKRQDEMERWKVRRDRCRCRRGRG